MGLDKTENQSVNKRHLTDEEYWKQYTPKKEDLENDLSMDGDYVKLLYSHEIDIDVVMERNKALITKSNGGYCG